MKYKAVVTTLLLFLLTVTACGNSRTDVLPFSGLEPGMTIEQAKQIEADLVETEDGYTLEKSYKDVVFKAKIQGREVIEKLSWVASSEKSEAGDMKTVVREIRSYCDKKYGKGQTGEFSAVVMMGWDDGTYIIDLTHGSGILIEVRKR